MSGALEMPKVTEQKGLQGWGNRGKVGIVQAKVQADET